MEEKELDLSKINSIDMECDVDPEDDGFGSFEVEPLKVSLPQNSEKELLDNPNIEIGPRPVGSANDDREISTKTGIVLDFGQTEYDIDPKEIEIVSNPIIVQDEQDILNAKNNTLTDAGMSRSDFSGINEIDMECSVGEDDDFGNGSFTPKQVSHSGDYISFDDDYDDIDKQLVNEEIVAESKKQFDDQISQGEVEDDYYDKLKKKHADSNKKGSYNVHFHFAGNPKLEMDDFNHDNTPQGPIPNITNINSGEVAGDSNMTVAAQGMGMGESYRKLFEDLLLITGFELSDCKDGKCSFKDKYSNAEPRVCSTINDVEDFLSPYIQDCFIIPLQVETGNKFKTCKEWSDWYTPEMETKYPQCKQDITYCDLCANHLPECKLF